MLVLSRRPNETFFIGDDVEIILLAVHGSKVRIGVKAPPGVQILRSELRAARPRASAPTPKPPKE